ncbi:hypothetical protein [Gracilimonas sp.]|uniref:hypothetical protein n=1 Tax=Gracilimonas sp. TaxID=1974203 RepID=UPI003BAD5EF4
MPETINRTIIDDLYNVKKYTLETIEWEDNGTEEGRAVKKKFLVDLIAEDGRELKWRGWYQNKRGIRKHGFSITYKKKYLVRGWDMGSQHWSHLEQRYIRGVGLHKHFFLNSMHEREVYEIPEGEISISDPNDAVRDFAIECNVDIKYGYQNAILL